MLVKNPLGGRLIKGATLHEQEPGRRLRRQHNVGDVGITFLVREKFLAKNIATRVDANPLESRLGIGKPLYQIVDRNQIFRTGDPAEKERLRTDRKRS